ncbi:MAG: hypothetical protein HYV60_08655 [Planctomycetia bacterium]|nr:hypothetical protein [Planctomycetia bacterium]
MEQVDNGSLVVHDQGAAVADSQRIGALLGEILEKNLRQLATRALVGITQ